MVFAIALAHVWGVVQLLVPGSLARTVRVRTLFAAMAVGLYLIGPLTVALQLAWIHPAASLLGSTIPHMRGIASYTLDPFLEEALKLLPLALLLRIATIRRQWTLTDCVLIAAATGSGYGLAENLYRYSSSANMAYAVAGGWAMDIGRNTVLVPGVWNTLTSWLPPGTSFVGDAIVVNSHLVWSALGGLALGLITQYRTMAARVAAGGLFLYIGVDHAAWNASLVSDSWLSLLAKPLGVLAAWGGVLAFAALAAAWWLDGPARTGVVREPLLAAGRAESARFAGMLKAAFSRLPGSIASVASFARTLTPSALKNALRRPKVILLLVLLTPSILFLILGGFPQTAWIQRLMTGPVVWPVVVILSTLSLVRVAWSVLAGVRNWSATRQLPIGDDAALIVLQLACGIGSIALGGFTLMRMFGGLSAGSHLLGSAHGADAANRMKVPDGMAVSNSAGAAVPPRPGRTLPGEAAPPNTKAAATPDAESAPPPTPQAPPKPKAPKSNPYDDAARRAEARAAQAEADAREAQEFRQKAIRAQDAADIANATADPGSDPGVAEARERTRKLNAASDEADRAALDGDDPWDPNAPNKTAHEMFDKEAREAAEDQKALENDFGKRKAAEVQSARETAKNAEDALNAANARAAEARQAADYARQAQARAADPLGTAASNADANYASAKAREDAAFEKPDAREYQDARKAAALAREQADEARAAANAAKDASSAQVIRKDDP